MCTHKRYDFNFVMSFVRALARRVLVNPQRIQAQLDIWQLYHLLYYFQQCGGKEVRVPRPKNVSFAKQYRAVYSAVTKQVFKQLSWRCVDPTSIVCSSKIKAGAVTGGTTAKLASKLVRVRPNYRIVTGDQF